MVTMIALCVDSLLVCVFHIELPSLGKLPYYDEHTFETSLLLAYQPMRESERERGLVYKSWIIQCHNNIITGVCVCVCVCVHYSNTYLIDEIFQGPLHPVLLNDVQLLMYNTVVHFSYWIDIRMLQRFIMM